MATRDYYNILGISRKAAQGEVKKAYRSLALRWHPDRNPSDPLADQRFKDITEAYKTLSDLKERARYDRLGPLFTPDGRPPRPEDLNSAVGTLFNNLFRRKTPTEKGEDLRYTLSLSLEEVSTGVERPVMVPRQVRCTRCSGDGAEPSGGREPCPVCKGSGRSSGPRLFRTSCYHCDGTGHHVVKACSTCSGDGRVPRQEELRVKVPPGVSTGQKLKLSQKGNDGRGTGATGDLFVLINVMKHDLFQRRGEDLFATLPLRYSELVLGADVCVPTLEGQSTIRIPALTDPNKVFRLGSRGLPRSGRPGRGDLHYHVQLEIPQALSPAQNAQLKAWDDSLEKTLHPRREAFKASVRERP